MSCPTPRLTVGNAEPKRRVLVDAIWRSMIGFNLIPRCEKALIWIPFGPFRRDAFKKVAAARLEARMYAEADAVLTWALIVYPADSDLLTAYALSANDRGLFSEALERWTAARMACPKRPLCWCGVAANLRSLQRTDEAQTTIHRALELFKGDACVLVEAARIAMARREFDEALGCWDKAIAAGDPHPDWLFGRADTLFKMKRFDEAIAAVEFLNGKVSDYSGLDAFVRALRRVKRQSEDDAPLPVADAVSSGATAMSPDVLFAGFEGLGDNCEFGLVQRYSHIEPLGLFRFAWSTTEALVEVFSRRLVDYGTDGDLELLVNDTDGSYDCRSIKYPVFQYHTDVHPSQIKYETLLRREAKKISYLKKRMLSDLAAAEKIFIRKGGSFESGVSLFRVMRDYGPVTLLWITVADEQHPPGLVEQVEDGLLKGYISRFAPYGNAHDIDLRCWAELCCNALALKGDGSNAQHYTLRQNHVYRIGLDWATSELCAKEDVVEPAFPGLTTQRLTLLTDTRRDNAIVAARYIDFELPPRSLVAFSLWLWIPDAFQGRFVDVYIANAASFVSMADIGRRGEWQRVWSSARLPKDQIRAAVALRITGFAGDVVFIGAWRLEEGSLPNDWHLNPATTALS